MGICFHTDFLVLSVFNKVIKESQVHSPKILLSYMSVNVFVVIKQVHYCPVVRAYLISDALAFNIPYDFCAFGSIINSRSDHDGFTVFYVRS